MQAHHLKQSNHNKYNDGTPCQTRFMILLEKMLKILDIDRLDFSQLFNYRIIQFRITDSYLVLINDIGLLAEAYFLQLYRN